MAAARSILSVTGKIYIEVPDATRYEDYPFVPFYYFDAEHINHFDLRSMGQLAAQHCRVEHRTQLVHSPGEVSAGKIRARAGAKLGGGGDDGRTERRREHCCELDEHRP